MNVTTEAIVNPANNNLMPGGGANKMIFYAAGDKLIEDCSKFKYCETGSAVYTQGFNIPAKYIIHAVGPYWHGGYNNEAQDLASCYISIMKIAESLKLKSLAIPALCTGRGGYPLDEAIDIAVSSVVSYLQSHNLDMEIWFMCYDHETLLRYRAKNMDGVNDVAQYFNRKTIKLKGKLSKKEKKILKKKLFKKEITKEQEQEALQLALKRLLKKKYPDVIYIAPPKTKDKITLKTCTRYECSGPFVTTDCVLDYSYDNEKINIEVQPYAFLDTPEELESKKRYFIDDNENSVPDQFESANQSSYNQSQKILKVANIENILSDISAGNDVNIEYVDVEKTDVKIEDIYTAEDDLAKEAMANEKNQNIQTDDESVNVEPDVYGMKPDDYVELLYEEAVQVDEDDNNDNDNSDENNDDDQDDNQYINQDSDDFKKNEEENDEETIDNCSEEIEVETVIESELATTEEMLPTDDTEETVPLSENFELTETVSEEVMESDEYSETEESVCNDTEFNFPSQEVNETVEESNLYIKNDDYVDEQNNILPQDTMEEYVIPNDNLESNEENSSDDYVFQENSEDDNVSEEIDNFNFNEVETEIDVSVETETETETEAVEDDFFDDLQETTTQDNDTTTNKNKNQYKKSKKDYRPNYNKYKKKNYFNKKSKK